ncbi:hypothetical protein [Henriciella litoralis]|uniref:hypothetical protein n=1 Tax=Henriciella litoralis TaxID=568102 RepID=UPI0009FD0F57|nr:hypothetical protein [Henriciella litoralis]
MSTPPHKRFLGKWVLDPASCKYEQGEAPVSGTYVISESGDDLAFQMSWTDRSGQDHDAHFQGKPDGIATPFNAPGLADSFSIDMPTPSELNSSASLNGALTMRATRTLIDDDTMRIVQTVFLPDGTQPSNRSVYYRD